MPAIISSGLVIDLVTEEISFKTLETLKTTPLLMSEAVWGKILACTFIIPVQSTAWLILLALNKIFTAQPLLILIHVTLVSSILIVIAAFIGLYYKDRSSSQLVFSALTVVLLMISLMVVYNPIHLTGMLAAGRFNAAYLLIVAAEAIVLLLLSWILERCVNRFTAEV
jgi:ABC-type Na+ efflux pump permease subunit